MDDTTRIDWLEKHRSVEVVFQGFDDETLWVAYDVRGNVNDREWHEIAKGDTFRKCVDNAIDYWNKES